MEWQDGGGAPEKSSTKLPAFTPKIPKTWDDRAMRDDYVPTGFKPPDAKTFGLPLSPRMV